MSRFLQVRIAASGHALFAAAASATSAVALGVASLTVPAAPVFAQAAPAAAKPASMELMNDLSLAAAVNVCELVVESKLPVEKAVLSTAKSITYVITSRYGSQVASAGKLQPEQIANGTIIQIVGRVRQGCYPKLAGADKKFVDDVLSEYSKAVNKK
ncbi:MULTISPECIES: hypothetical protein [Aphanothece]|uniref:hypothetical protein n=1 Tax=Aphanothece TaxID=1121 RepID=UPI003984C589